MAESHRKSELGPVESVDAVDDYTVRFNLKQPYAPLLAQLSDRSGMMISPKAAKAMSPAEFGAKPVCSGPFTFVERVPQEKVVVKKFDKYWNAANIHFDQITYITMPDSVVRFSNVQSGQLDIGVGILATDIKRGEADPRIKMYSTPGLGFDFLHINVGLGAPEHRPAGDQSEASRGARAFHRPQRPGGRRFRTAPISSATSRCRRRAATT